MWQEGEYSLAVVVPHSIPEVLQQHAKQVGLIATRSLMMTDEEVVPG